MSLKYYYTSLIMVFLFSFQLVYRNAVIYLYSQYKEKIASQYCENRFNQNKECKGKCYLNKQINEDSKQNSNHFSLSKLKSEYYFQETLEIKFYLNENYSEILDYYFLNPLYIVISPLSPPPKLKNLS